MSETRNIAVTVNGMRYEADRRRCGLTLSDFLRHELGLYGTHVGCEHGVCGACTVLVDGRAVRSCTQFAVECDGAAVVHSRRGLVGQGELGILPAGLPAASRPAMRLLHRREF